MPPQLQAHKVKRINAPQTLAHAFTDSFLIYTDTLKPVRLGKCLLFQQRYIFRIFFLLRSNVGNFLETFTVRAIDDNKINAKI